jgi:hypothetical protein
MTGRFDYRESGMRISGVRADLVGVNVHGPIPTVWVKAVMLSLNLLVWFDALLRIGG